MKITILFMVWVALNTPFIGYDERLAEESEKCKQLGNGATLEVYRAPQRHYRFRKESMLNDSFYIGVDLICYRIEKST